MSNESYLDEPPHKLHPTFVKRYLIGIFLPIAVGFVLFFLIWRIPKADVTLLIAFMAFVLMVVVCCVISSRLFANVACPNCAKTKLPRWKPSTEPGAKYSFFCSTCGVVWDTGISESDSVDGTGDGGD